MTSDPLEHRTIAELEDASRRLNAHIRDRKNRTRPSMARRVIGLLLSIPAICSGIALFIWSIRSGHLLGYPAIIGPVLFAGGVMWTYADWFDGSD